ncbi:MAG: pyridoxamine 5'-phosphate oxidase family protein [Candidatus Eremiobacteraeota bacterium]|nr:pyridoxamine 5'-phosphate oxidase family protein [Candidatus Eremiobacteraeota bacterium]
MLGDLTKSQIEAFLHESVIGRVGCHAYGQTYVVPITYAYDGTYIYAHTAPGMKLHMMRGNPHVCFEIDSMDDLANWQSVIALGTFEELRGAAADEAMRFLIERIETRLSGPPGASVHPNSAMERLVVFRIKLEQKTGRFERRV